MKLVAVAVMWAARRALKFTPLEFETKRGAVNENSSKELKFTPLEFETLPRVVLAYLGFVLKFTPLEFETSRKFYEVDGEYS